MTNALFFLHELLAGALFYTCFCRAVHMERESTTVSIRFAFYLLSLASVLMIAAPIVSTWRPSVPAMVLMLAISVVQIVTAKHWFAGVPQQFKAKG